MRHKRAIRTLGRKRSSRRAMFRNMSSSLLMNGSIVTTDIKAKELKKYFEPLITEARGELSLASRRSLISKLGDKAGIEELREVAVRHKERPGGYLRLTKVGRSGGNRALMTKVEIIE